MSTAVQYGRTNYSYEKMAVQVVQFIKSLEGIGVKRGSLVGIQCNHIYLQLILNLAVEAIGATHTVISKVPEENIAEVVNACQFLFLQDLLIHNPPHENLHWITDSWIYGVELLQICDEDLDRLNHKIAPQDVVMLSGTSGTSGIRKFFEDTRGALSASVNLFEKLFFNPIAKTNFITVYPMTVGASYAGALAALKNGSTIFITTIDQFDEGMMQFPCSHSVLTVRDAYILQKLYGVNLKRSRLASLRVFGAALPQDLGMWLECSVSEVVVNAYSSTEAGLIAGIQKDGVGTLYPNAQVKIVDLNHKPLPYGERGTLMVKSDQMIGKYLWNENLTKKHFINGWFLTSDYGYKLNEMQIVILGRNDDLLNLGGLKVSPYLMEDKIKVIDGVSDCILANPKESSVGVVYVCIERDGLVSESRIIDLIRPLLSYDDELISYFFFKKFSRTKTGKIKRIKLLQEISQGKIRSY
jgi:acyl-coenzyme A synthetase/AMP-(fatty) acid ligase